MCVCYRFVEPFAEEVDYWERTLSTIGEVLETTVLIQRGYMHMDNIFTSEDIRKQLPKEADEYNKLTLSWIKITSRMASHGLALQATHDPRMYRQKMSVWKEKKTYSQNMWFEEFKFGEVTYWKIGKIVGETKVFTLFIRLF